MHIQQLAKNNIYLSTDTRFYKLPYIGEYSNVVKNKVRNIVKRCCKDGTSIKLIFTPCKIGSFFNLKDKTYETTSPTF